MTNTDIVSSRYEARLSGILSPAFRSRRIFIGGLGGGSFAAELLARCLPARIWGADFDVVEVENLSRTNYTAADAAVRRPKAEALAARIDAVAPGVEFVPIARDVTTVSDPELSEIFANVDLIIGGTDRLVAQAFLNEQAVRFRVPAVFIGVHQGARGGRVIWTVPGDTACYRCAAADRFVGAESGTDPGPADLAGAHGSVIDTLAIDMVATRVALALLERGQASTMGRFYEAIAGRNEIVVRTDPAYAWGADLWRALLADLPTAPRPYAAELGQYLCAGDALWFRTPRDPSCPACGGL